jgi:hypothetical protein
MPTTNNHRRQEEGCNAIKFGDRRLARRQTLGIADADGGGRYDRLSSIVRLPIGDMEPWAATESEINTEIRDEKANSS